MFLKLTDILAFLLSAYEYKATVEIILNSVICINFIVIDEEIIVIDNRYLWRNALTLSRRWLILKILFCSLLILEKWNIKEYALNSIINLMLA